MITFPVSFAVFVGLSQRVRDSHITPTHHNKSPKALFMSHLHTVKIKLCAMLYHEKGVTEM